jgi:hypothetical protein
MCFHLGNKSIKKFTSTNNSLKKNFFAKDHGSFQTNPSNSKLGKCHYCGAKRHWKRKCETQQVVEKIQNLNGQLCNMGK